MQAKAPQEASHQGSDPSRASSKSTRHTGPLDLGVINKKYVSSGYVRSEARGEFKRFLSRPKLSNMFRVLLHHISNFRVHRLYNKPRVIGIFDSRIGPSIVKYLCTAAAKESELCAGRHSLFWENARAVLTGDRSERS